MPAKFCLVSARHFQVQGSKGNSSEAFEELNFGISSMAKQWPSFSFCRIFAKTRIYASMSFKALAKLTGVMNWSSLVAG